VSNLQDKKEFIETLKYCGSPDLLKQSKGTVISYYTTLYL